MKLRGDRVWGQQSGRAMTQAEMHHRMVMHDRACRMVATMVMMQDTAMRQEVGRVVNRGVWGTMGW